MKKLLLLIITVLLLGYTYQTAQAPTGQLLSNQQAKRFLYIKCVGKIPKQTKSWNSAMKECNKLAEYQSKEWKPL